MEAALKIRVSSFFSEGIEDEARLSVETHVEQSLRSSAKDALLSLLEGLNFFCGVGLENLFDVLSLCGCFFFKFFFLLLPELLNSFLFSLIGFLVIR